VPIVLKKEFDRSIAILLVSVALVIVVAGFMAGSVAFPITKTLTTTFSITFKLTETTNRNESGTSSFENYVSSPT